MASINFTEQLIDSMIAYVEKLEISIKSKNFDEANKIKTYLFDLHIQVNKSLSIENV